MKVRILKNVNFPNMYYEKGEEYNYDSHGDVFKVLVKAGYAEEVKEPSNHYIQHEAHGERYLHFPICTTCKYASNYNEAPCIYCKLRDIDMQAEINSKLIDLIKSL